MKLIQLIFLSTILISYSCNKKPTCDDGILNGSEIKIDCGGTCDVCPSCFDGILNQDEVEVDCGGSCASCPAAWSVLQTGSTNNLRDVAFFDDEQTGLIVGDNGTLLRSTDAGDTWSALSLTSSNLTSIFILNNWAYVSGRNILLVSQDKGLSWTSKAAPINDWNDVWFFDTQNGVMVGDSLWAIRTADGGDTWISELRDFFDPTPFGSVSFINDQGGVAGADSRLFITSNGGKSWNMASSNADSIGGMGLISDVIMVNSNRTILSAEQGMFISNNNLIWLNKGYQLSSGELDYNEEIWLYCGSDDSRNFGVTFSSKDDGVSWTEENLPNNAPSQYGLAIVSNTRSISVGKSGSAFLREQSDL